LLSPPQGGEIGRVSPSAILFATTPLMSDESKIRYRRRKFSGAYLVSSSPNGCCA
jgi:hypothetical protein